jgi:hypothetical protein
MFFVRRPARRTPIRLFAARFDCRNFGEIGREIVCGKVFNTHFNQAYERAAEVWFRLTAPIDNHADSSRGQQRKREFYKFMCSKTELACFSI